MQFNLARTAPASAPPTTLQPDPLTAALEKAARSHSDARFRSWCARLLRGDAAGGGKNDKPPTTSK